MDDRGRWAISAIMMPTKSFSTFSALVIVTIVYLVERSHLQGVLATLDDSLSLS